MIAPVVYTPLATAVWADVLGVTVFAAWVVSWDVADLVPALTYPAVWVADAVINPLLLTEILGVAWVAVDTDFEVFDA